MVWIRWLLAALAPIAVLGTSLAAGLLTMGQLNRGCPQDSMAGGQCVTAGHITALGVGFFAVVLVAVIGGGWGCSAGRAQGQGHRGGPGLLSDCRLALRPVHPHRVAGTRFRGRLGRGRSRPDPMVDSHSHPKEQTMKTLLKTALVVLVAIISVPVTELSMASWLPTGAALFDATQSINLWLFCIVPVGLAVVTLQALALWRIYRSNPLRYGLTYGCVVVPFHTFLLHRFFNPPGGHRPIRPHRRRRHGDRFWRVLPLVLEADGRSGVPGRIATPHDQILICPVGEWHRSKVWKCASISLRVGSSRIALMVTPCSRLATRFPSGVSKMACAPRLRKRRRQDRRCLIHPATELKHRTRTVPSLNSVCGWLGT